MKISFEVNSPGYTGEIVKTYKKDSVIEVTARIPGYHEGGEVSVHICEAGFKNDPTQECLDNNALLFEETGETVVRLQDRPFPKNGKTFTFKVR